MNKCSLCGKKMSSTKNSHFGLNCLKKSCKWVNIKDVKNLKGEKELNQRVMQMFNKQNLPVKQQILLTNRYLTLRLLNEVNMPCYDELKKDIINDIEKVSPDTIEKELKTIDTMPLKYANQILFLYTKYKLADIAWDEKDKIYYNENIAFNTILFGFSYYYNKKPYLSDMLQEIQLLIWKAGILALKATGNDCSAKLLQHSLQQFPTEIVIANEDSIITKIKDDNKFKEKIKAIVEKYGTQKNFDTNNYNTKEDKKYKVLNYTDTDLVYALNNTNIQVKETKFDDKWELSVIITDIYDFTDYKELHEFINTKTIKGVISLTANNMAMISTSCGLINQYNITIKFSLIYEK